MINSWYMVDGIDLRFSKFQIYEDNQTVRLFTNVRPYDLLFDKMPEFLQSWIPVKMEGVESYDHINAEMGLPQPPNSMGVAVTKKSADINLDDEDNEQVMMLEALYVNLVEAQVADSEFYKAKLREVTLNLKDIKNNNKAYADQAKQINNIAANVIKMNLANMQIFINGIKQLGGKKSKRKQKPQDGQTGNENP